MGQSETAKDIYKDSKQVDKMRNRANKCLKNSQEEKELSKFVMILSESSLAKTWLNKKEDEVWKGL